MKMFLRLLSTIILLTSCFSLTAFGAAASIDSQKDAIIVDGLQFNFSKSVEGKISTKILKEIANQVKSEINGRNVVSVNIDKIVYAESIDATNSIEQNNASGFISPQAWYDLYVDWDVVFSNVHSTNGAAQFIISVAKGQTISLTSSKTFKATWGYSSSVSLPGSAVGKLESNLNTEISHTYTTSIQWVGPPESSSAVSRIYYWTPYYDRGDFTITGTGWPSGDSYGPYTGIFTEPSYFVQWSMDVS